MKGKKLLNYSICTSDLMYKGKQKYISNSCEFIFKEDHNVKIYLQYKQIKYRK